LPEITAQPAFTLDLCGDAEHLRFRRQARVQFLPQRQLTASKRPRRKAKYGDAPAAPLRDARGGTFESLELDIIDDLAEQRILHRIVTAQTVERRNMPQTSWIE